VPLEVQATGMKLWGFVDDEGRAELRPDLIAAHVAPGQDATALVEDHLLALAESGFLVMYPASDRWWIQLRAPLKTPRPLPSECPPEPSGRFLAVGGAREGDARDRAREQARREAWAQAEVPRRPDRPAVLDAPPIGCPEHPDGRFKNCGPCGTARRRHDKWMADRRYIDQLTEFYEAGGEDDDEPF
jgi:hypothetical protein